MCSFVSIEEINSGNDVYTGIWLKQQIYLVNNTDTGEGWSAFKGCGSYPNGLEYDGNWKTAAAFTIIAVVLGAALCFALYFAMCMVIADSVWKLFGLLLILNALFQGLTFLFLASNACSEDRPFWKSKSLLADFFELGGGCQLASGGNLSIAATVLWFVTGVLTLFTPNPSNEGLSLLSEEKAEAKQDNEEDLADEAAAEEAIAAEKAAEDAEDDEEKK